MKIIVWIQTSFEGFHRWKDSPEGVEFLRDYHRHIFRVKLGVEAKHDDRDIEFFQLKRDVERYIKEHYQGEYFGDSCEMIAMKLLARFNADFVEVSEDGENGATVSDDKNTTLSQRSP